MKKLIILLPFVVYSFIADAQLMQLYFSLPDSTTVFGRVLPKYQVLYVRDSKKWYVLNTNASAAAKLSNSDVSLIAGSGGGGSGYLYQAGTGLTLTNDSIFNHAVHTADATGATSLTVVALRGRVLSTVIPTSGNVLGWNGTYWIPSSAGTTYEAGIGIDISGGTITNTAPNINQDLSFDSTTKRLSISSGVGVTLPMFTTANATSGYGLVPSSNGAGATSYLNGNGNWDVPVGTLYTSGTGLTLAAGAFSHTPHTGDATGATTLTVEGLQGRSIATTAPTIGSILGWDGTYWTNAEMVRIPTTSSSTVGVLTQTSNGVDSVWMHSYGTRNRFIGIGSGNFTLTGSENVGLSSKTLASLTTGIGNIAIGTNALTANTVQNYNIAIGLNALKGLNYNTATTNNTGNIAIGYESLLRTNPNSTATGVGNTAIGYQSGRANVLGTNNVFIGTKSGIIKTGGGECVYIGYESNANSTTASINCIGIGFQALYQSTGNRVTGVGHSSLFAASGVDNTALGYWSGVGISSGAQGTYIGSNAGMSTSTGASNIAVGFKSLMINTTGSFNVHIGIGTSNAAIDYSYTTAIGDAQIMAASNQTKIGSSTSNKIHTDNTIFSSGTVGIGTTNAYTRTVSKCGCAEFMLTVNQYSNVATDRWGKFCWDSLAFFNTVNGSKVIYVTSAVQLGYHNLSSSDTVIVAKYIGGTGLSIYAGTTSAVQRIKSFLTY